MCGSARKKKRKRKSFGGSDKLSFGDKDKVHFGKTKKRKPILMQKHYE